MHALSSAAVSRQSPAKSRDVWPAADYTEVADAEAAGAALPATARLVAAEIEFSMALFALEKRHLFYDRGTQTKVVIAWNADTVVLAARGTAERSNVLEDAKARPRCRLLPPAPVPPLCTKHVALCLAW